MTIVSEGGGSTRLIWTRAGPADPMARRAQYSWDGTQIYFMGIVAGENPRIGLWTMPAGGGQPREIVRFDDPYRLPLRGMFGTDGKRFFVTIDDRQSDIWAADVRGLE